MRPYPRFPRSRRALRGRFGGVRRPGRGRPFRGRGRAGRQPFAPRGTPEMKTWYSRQSRKRKSGCLEDSGDESAGEGGSTKYDEANAVDAPILPSAEDVGPNSEPPQLNKNLAEGKYDDPSHYLDTQFRLLKEDLLGPLRAGIRQYRDCKQRGRKVSKLDDGYCYTGVRLYDIEPRSGGVGCRVRFDVHHLKRTRWRNNKRLLQGNMLCLSSDDFDTFICATVDERKIEDLARGEIVLLFISKLESVLNREKQWVMIEATSYYEAYRHVLNRLQNLSERAKSGMEIPFQKYLVYCEQSQEPRYIKGASVNFGVLSKRDQTERDPSFPDIGLFYHNRHNIFKPSEPDKWDALLDTSLDHSQIAALENIMTKELSIVQGPPGTGKSFIGLCFVNILLANKKVWKTGMDHIMIVCYTNHALDQFLESIVADNPMATMVRIGGGCKSEDVEPYTIWNRRKQYKFANRSGIYNMKREISNLNMQLKNYTSLLNCNPPDAAVSTVGPSIPQNQVDSLLKSGYRMIPSVIVWLMGAVVEDSQDGYYQRILDETYQASRQQSAVPRGGDDEAFREELRLMEDEVRQWQLERDMGEEDWLPEMMNEGLPDDHSFLLPEGVRQRLSRSQPMPEAEAEAIDDVWQLSRHSRYELYLNWFVAGKKKGNAKTLVVSQKLRRCYSLLEVLHHQNDLQVVQDSEIIGLTTTGAAKYQKIIQTVQPRIVIVEEAAEVLEAHIVTALTENCEHLVLIGDHKQLRPKPTMYKLAKDYNLDVSLFERMVRNKLPVSTLEYQHRMRPEISQFLVPHIYTELKDHDVVKDYDHVRGVKGDVIFLNHEEGEAAQDDTRSHSNDYEATMIVGLCIYLLRRQYDSDQVTVLTMYTGQMWLIKQKLRQANVFGIRVTPVDSFQGEENDIIILSCVRSNQNGKIGFLKASNRICVSLSRAKMGFYALGNFTMYSEADRVWKNIIGSVSKKGHLKKHFTMYCAKHDKATMIAKPDDYKKVPFGGCAEQCSEKLECGHVCERICHVNDPEHKEYICRKPCKRECENGHRECKNRCKDECSPCHTMITVTKPDCGHQLKVECYRQYDPCTRVVERQLKCGHVGFVRCDSTEEELSRYKCKKRCERKCENGHQTCRRLCYERCPPCKTVIKVTNPRCGHEYTLACFKEHNCPKACEKMLVCGHKCTRPCGSTCTEMCKERVKIGRPCGHDFEMSCFLSTVTENPWPMCSRPCEKSLPCGHRCPQVCGRPCSTDCLFIQDVPSPCGHSMKVPCWKVESASTRKCRVVVEKKLTCGRHRRRVECHEDVTKLSCQQRCKKKLRCGHEALVKCSQDPKTAPCYCQNAKGK